MQRGLARWARLGHLNIFSTTNDPQLEDHWIVEHVIHPDYELSARYNDIALFRLEKEVKFSKYVRPICLNADPLINPTVQIATGWGQIYTGELTMVAFFLAILLFITINVNFCFIFYRWAT